jgi:hypothetical protein
MQSRQGPTGGDSVDQRIRIGCNRRSYAMRQLRQGTFELLEQPAKCVGQTYAN